MLKTTAHQNSIIEEKLQEVLRDPKYSKADKVETERVIEQLQN